MKLISAITAALLFSLLMPAAAQQTIKDLSEVLPKKKNETICYARSYDAAHLKAHPQQKITSVVLSIKFDGLPKEEKLDPYSFGLAVKVRGRAKPLEGFGNCHPLAPLSEDYFKGMKPEEEKAARAVMAERLAVVKTKGLALECYIECDGGSMMIEPAPKGNALHMHLDRLRMNESCDTGESAVDIQRGADDRTFRLDKASAAVCKSLDMD